jgi:dephospho-CoA kinase
MRVIGLTGGIASGKSTVARLLAERGVPVIDADHLARQAVMPGMPAAVAIRAAFGDGVFAPDGTLDRAVLGNLVFRDATARRRLEGIMHPAIGQLAEAKLAELRRAGAPLVIYMAPLLIEAGVIDRVDEIWVVYVDRETQLRRLMARDRIEQAEAESRLDAQLSMEEKKAYGRLVIDNRGTPEELAALVEELWLRELAGQLAGWTAVRT